MEDFNLRKFLKEQREENQKELIEEYLIDLYNLFASEDYEEGEEVKDLISREEYSNPEAYEDAEMFGVAYNYIKQQGGSIIIEGEPDITFSIKGEDIEMKFIAQY